MLLGDPRWNATTKVIVECCLAVHRVLGPGLLESVYDDSLAWELGRRGVSLLRQAPVPILYDGQLVGSPLRLDFLVEDTVIVEIKAVEKVHPIHQAQLLSYLRLADKPVGLLANFHELTMKAGIQRVIHPKWFPIEAEKDD